MAEEGHQSIQARIAALKLSQVGRAPVTADGSPPEKPQLYIRSHSTCASQNLGLTHNGNVTSNGIGNEPNGPRRDGMLPPPTGITRTGQAIDQPAKPAPIPPPRLPARKQSGQPSPALPPRRPSEQQLSRRDSTESISSTISTVSALSNGTRTPGSRTPSMDAGRIKAPVFDSSNLPPLPPKRTKEDIEKRYQDIEKSKAFPGYRDAERSRMPMKSTKSTPSVAMAEVMPPITTPTLPPRRPARSTSQLTSEQPPPKPAGSFTNQTIQEQPPPKPARSALSYSMNKPEDRITTNGVNGRDPSPTPPKIGVPPPIPLSSRPDVTKFQPSKPTLHSQNQVQSQIWTASTASGSPCLVCRDFTAPDTHAANFPRASVPSLDWLATQLTTPFSSATDQARSIFTWLHHNISYDVVAFFNHNVQPSTPASTLHSGLAVCEGYAGLFTALATKAGLESIVIGGHGKGYGFSTLKPGDPLPAESTGHAWNAVKIDNGFWKLIDPCWGAGNVNGKGQPYNKHFSPRQFTMSNEEFGLRHYPANKSHFFRDDGRRLGWEEYILGDTGGELVQVYSGVAEKEGISETAFLPKYKKIPISPSAHPGPTIRFQFSRVCEHWDPIRNGAGKPFLFILAIHGIDGREDEYVFFETNGAFWWADVEPRRLGARGQT
ncbi:hypothetical protein P7C71_g5530, partial [Lecanoromycetidae sp. Uapishka_2]